jgi:hypothetical protein
MTGRVAVVRTPVRQTRGLASHRLPMLAVRRAGLLGAGPRRDISGGGGAEGS